MTSLWVSPSGQNVPLSVTLVHDNILYFTVCCITSFYLAKSALTCHFPQAHVFLRNCPCLPFSVHLPDTLTFPLIPVTQKALTEVQFGRCSMPTLSRLPSFSFLFYLNKIWSNTFHTFQDRVVDVQVRQISRLWHLMKMTRTSVCLKHVCDTYFTQRFFSFTLCCFQVSTPNSNVPGSLWVVNVIITLFMSPYCHWLAAPLGPTPSFDRNNSCTAREQIFISIQANLLRIIYILNNMNGSQCAIMWREWFVVLSSNGFDKSLILLQHFSQQPSTKTQGFIIHYLHMSKTKLSKVKLKICC